MCTPQEKLQFSKKQCAVAYRYPVLTPFKRDAKGNPGNANRYYNILGYELTLKVLNEKDKTSADNFSLVPRKN
jgi:hypothetical protein